MKRIKIFLASSIEELRLDRLEIGDFFDRLNGIYHDRGIDLKLIKCENYDNSIAINGKQSEYDDEIRDSELVFFLFFKKVGDVTRHEFEVAVESFKKKDKPHIVTYFKYTESLDEVTDEVKAFMGMLADEMNHYYNSYRDIDTLKLGMLMQIQLFTPAFGDIKIEDGKITLNGEEFISTTAIPIFSGNKNLQQLKEELKSVNESFLPLQKKFIENPADKNAYSEFLAVANKKAELEDSLKEAEENTLKLLKSMVKNQSEGGLSLRQKEGYRLLEMGDYDGALEVLSLDEIYSDIEKNEVVLEYSKEALQQNVNELLSRIEALEAKGVTPEIIDEIYEIYKKACELSEKNNLKKDALFEFVNFLHTQKKYNEAIELAKKLELYYQLEKTEENKAAELYDIFGQLYHESKQFEESERYHLMAISIYEALYSKDKAAYSSDLVSCCNNIGCLYISSEEYENAETYHLKALEILNASGTENSESFEENAASIYNNLAAAYSDMQKYEEAEEYYLKAIELCESLILKNKKSFEIKLAKSYNNLGVLYNIIGDYEKAEIYCVKAVGLTKELVSKNPEAFEHDLSIHYINTANLYKIIEENEKAEEYLLKGIEILERLSLKNTEIFTGTLASAYVELTGFYVKIGKYDGTEKSFLRAIEVLEGLKNDALLSDLASTYNNIGVLYVNSKRYSDSEAFYFKALGVLEKPALKNDSAFDEDLATTYNNIGNLYVVWNDYIKAEAYYLKEAKIRENMVRENPEACEKALARLYLDLGNLYYRSDSAKNAVKYYERAQKIKEKNADANRDDLLQIYYFLGDLYFKEQKNGMARDLFVKSMTILEKMFEKAPSAEGIRLSNTYISIAITYIAENKTSEAKPFLDKAKSICERFRYKNREYAELLEYINDLYRNYGI